MHIVGQRNSLYVIALIFATLLASYSMLWITGTTLQEAQDVNWFFSSKELQDPPFFSSMVRLSLWKFELVTISFISCFSSLLAQGDSSWLDYWTAPAPMGVWVMMLHGDVHWPAFRAGISTMSALAFLYLIRCSLHAAALKKNIPNVTRKGPEPSSPKAGHSLRRTSSAGHTKARREPLSLGKILENGYGYSQLLAALTGGIAVAPAVAASLTLFKVRMKQLQFHVYQFSQLMILYLLCSAWLRGRWASIWFYPAGLYILLD